jgi:hypothetical protein
LIYVYLDTDCGLFFFLKVPYASSSGAQRRPVGIRTLPNVEGPRTGEGLFPGDVVEIVQSIHDDDNNQVYLRLADDRGWVFENHPTVRSYHLLFAFHCVLICFSYVFLLIVDCLHIRVTLPLWYQQEEM